MRQKVLRSHPQTERERWLLSIAGIESKTEELKLLQNSNLTPPISGASFTRGMGSSAGVGKWFTSLFNVLQSIVGFLSSVLSLTTNRKNACYSETPSTTNHSETR